MSTQLSDQGFLFNTAKTLSSILNTHNLLKWTVNMLELVHIKSTVMYILSQIPAKFCSFHNYVLNNNLLFTFKVSTLIETSNSVFFWQTRSQINKSQKHESVLLMLIRAVNDCLYIQNVPLLSYSIWLTAKTVRAPTTAAEAKQTNFQLQLKKPNLHVYAISLDYVCESSEL